MKDALVGWWGSLGERERRLLVAGAALVALVVVWATLWDPAVVGTKKLETDLPPLRAQTASMRAMSADAQRLRATNGAPVAIAPADREAAVRRTLDRAGLARATTIPVAQPSGPVTTLSTGGVVVTAASRGSGVAATPAEVTADASGRVRVRLANVDYGVWIAWLANAETELAARAVQVQVASLAPDGPVGHVRAEASLDWAAPSPASGAR